jgi:multidrug efflux pump subunit AcrA (membrane-fusion protein)
MKLSISFLLLATSLLAAPDAKREQNTVVLDANAVANLRLKFDSAEPRLFEETAFALGRLESRPGATAAVSSRIAGRVVALAATLGESVRADAEIVHVESRQAGDPPPVIALRAPQSGIVTALDVHLGDPVEPATALLEITDLSEVHAVARVPEAVAGRLRLGETQARIRLTAFPGEVLTGELVRLGTEADPASGTLAAHFRVPNPDGRLRPGLRAEFALILSSRADVLSVPREAVQGEGTAPRVVFTKDFELPGAFVKTLVVLGATNDRYIEIIGGLFPGDEVVTTGAYSLSFAGGGGVSLKEALDAAHGHEHAADGSELKSGAAATSASTATDDDHGHAHGEEAHAGHPERPWQIATGVLALIALVLAFVRRSTPNRKEN